MKLDRHLLKLFLLQQVADGVPDAISAATLSQRLHMPISASTISYWRMRFQIPPGDKFQRNFRHKYGSDAVERFQGLIESGTPLRTIAAAFGFSTEYARQVYQKVYGQSTPAHPLQPERWCHQEKQ